MSKRDAAWATLVDGLEEVADMCVAPGAKMADLRGRMLGLRGLARTLRGDHDLPTVTGTIEDKPGGAP